MSSNLFADQSPFEAIDLERRKRLVKSTSRATLPAVSILFIVWGAMYLSNPSWQIGVVAGHSALMLISPLIAGRLAERNRPNRGSYLMVTHFLFGSFLNVILIDGLDVALAPAFATIIVIAGMLIGARGGYYASFVSITLWVLATIINTAELITPAPLPAPLPEISIIMVVMMTLIFIAVLGRVATEDLRRALDDATFELVQTNSKLEKANKLKSQFTARTSHELRTPLSAIIVFTDLSLRGAYGALVDKQKESQQRVLANARRLETLISDLLDLAKIEAGELEIVEEDVAINTLVENIITTLEPKAREKSLDLNVIVEANMPSIIRGDENRLTQILSNLTENAIKFTEQGGVNVTIQKANRTSWKAIVKDTGRGIHEEQFEAIFDEFRQGDSASDAKQGTGLGLAISQNLVKMMGGEISVHSEIGKGSTFEFTLPLQEPIRELLTEPL